MDRAFWDYYSKDIDKSFHGIKASNLPRNGVKDFPIHHYDNSGAGAIALARYLGAKKIILLGYDCQITNGLKHWHGDHPKGLYNAGTMPKWFAHFENVAKDFKELEIINCSRQTALTMFKRENLEDTLNECD